MARTPNVPGKPSGTILMMVFVVGGIAAARSWTKGETPDPRIIWGVPLAAVVFSVIGEFSPDLARGLSLLMIVSAVFIGGPDVWDSLRKATTQAPANRKSGRRGGSGTF